MSKENPLKSPSLAPQEMRTEAIRFIKYLISWFDFEPDELFTPNYVKEFAHDNFNMRYEDETGPRY